MVKLSFSLPEYDFAVIKLVGQVKSGFDKLDPILGDIQTASVIHRGTIRQVSEPEIVETEMQKYSLDIVLELDWIRETDVESFAGAIFQFCEQLRSQQMKDLLELVSRTSETIGNRVDAAGKNIWDSLYEMMDKTEIHFNEVGGHNYQLIMHPNTVKKLEENPPSPEQLQRMEDLMASKRQSFYARKRTRKLSR